MSYTVTKTIRFTAKEDQTIITINTTDAGWVNIDDTVFIPPELLRPIAEALLELAR